MIVYRIEGHNGIGPYQAYEDESFRYAVSLCVDHSDDAHSQPRGDDLLGYIDANEFCGLDSAQALVDWFDGWFDRLHADDFVVTFWEADARVGRNGQALFIKSASTLLGSMSIPSFLRDFYSGKLDVAA